MASKPLTDAKIADLRATWTRAVPHPESGRIECSHDEMFTLLVAIPRLLEEVTRSRALLKRCASVYRDADETNIWSCAICGAEAAWEESKLKHDADCELAALIGT
jgi:hypothetical protein